MYRRIPAVEHRKRAAGLADTHPGLQDRILLIHTRIENAHKVRKKIFNFFMHRSPASYLFSFFLDESLSNA